MKFFKHWKKFIVITGIFGAMSLTGCANMPRYMLPTLGAALGAAAGATLYEDHPGVGAAIGGALGSVTGHYGNRMIGGSRGNNSQQIDWENAKVRRY